MAEKNIHVDLNLNGSRFREFSNIGSSTITFDGLQSSNTITINDANVTENSLILLQITVPNNRDLDEMEELFQLSFGNIVEGVSFDVHVINITGGAEGTYKIIYFLN